MTTPIWLMDVDGVLNTFEYADPMPHNDYTSFEALGFQITYSPSLVKRIVDLHNDKSVEVRWLTTWQSRANTELRERFGFETDLVVEGGDCPMGFGTGSSWWKFPLARSAAENYGRIIWTDDDIDYFEPAREWISKQDSASLFAVSPVPCLTHKDLDEIEEWLR